MYYNIVKNFRFFCGTYRLQHQCYGSENFPNSNMLLKVDHFERFSSCSNVNELMINSTSGNDYKLNNNLA